MAHRLQLVDANGMLAFDFTDETGASNPHGLQAWPMSDLALGFSSGDPVFFEPSSRPGGLLVKRQERLIESSFHLKVDATDADELHFGVSALDSLLKKGGTLEWQPDGGTTRYVDFETGWTEGLLRGQDASMLYIRSGDWDGLPITIVRQPGFRLDELDSDTNKLRNSTLLFDSNGDGRPDEWAWLVATNISAESIDDPTEAYKFNIATTSARSLQQQSAVGSFTSGDVVTFSFYVKAASAGVISARGAVQFYQADGTTVVGSENVGTLTDIGSSWTRITVTTTAAGALTSRATVSVRFQNDAATDTAVWVRRAQLEVGSTASSFVPSSEIVPNNPLVTKTPAPTPPVATNGGAISGLLTGGPHSWVMTNVTAAGETLPSNKSNVVHVDGLGGGASDPGKADLVIPLGPSETTSRKIYRTVTGDTGAHKLVATIPNNTATTYQDNTADASLGANAPTSNTAELTDKLGRLYPVFIQGEAPTPVTFELKGDAHGFIQAAHLASLSALEDGGKSLAHFVNGPRILQCEDGDITNITDVHAGPNTSGTIVADPEASDEQSVKYESGDMRSSYGRLLRFELDDTDVLEGFRGTFEWKLRLTTNEKYHAEFQLRWADSMEVPAPFTNLPVRHNTDLDGLASLGYVEINLGKTALPTEGTLDGLALEVWARELSASATIELSLDCLVCVPTEQSAFVSLPYTGRAIVSEDSTQAELGSQLGANTWRVTWRYSIQAPTSSFVIALRIRRDTQDTGTIVREFQKDRPNDITNVIDSLEFDSLAGVTYFVDTDTFAGSATITVHEIIIEKVCGVEENEVLVTDPNLGVDRAYKLTDMGRYMCPAFAAGPMPFWLEPGLHLIYVDVSEPRIGGLYPELKSELRRRPTLSHRYAPRYPA